MTVAAIHFVISRITWRTAVIWLAYFGLLFIPGQLTMVRQNLASALVLLALLLCARQKILGPVALVAAAATIHITMAPLIALPFIIRLRPHVLFAVGVVVLGVMLTTAGISLFSSTLMFIAPLLPVVLEAYAFKMMHYASFSNAEISAAYVALAIAQVGMLGALYVLSRENERRDPYIQIGMWLLIWQLAVQLFLYTSIDLWARAMLISFPWGLAAVLRLYWWDERGRLSRIAVTGVATLGSLFVYTRIFITTLDPSPLIPYHSLVHTVLGYDSDGRKRAVAAWVRDYPNQVDIQQALAQWERLGVLPAAP